MRIGRRRLITGGAPLLAAAALVGLGSIRIPSGPASGTSFEGEAARPPPASRTFRAVTFNMHGGKGPDGRRDIARTAEALRGADIAGLNEVRASFLLEDEDQAAALGTRLGLAWLLAPVEERWWHHRFGNAALTRLPVRGWERIPIAGGRTPRNILLFRVEHLGASITVLVTHAEHGGQAARDSQIGAIARLFLAQPPPAILLGDLNAGGDHPGIQELLAAEGVVDPLAAALGRPYPRRLDWILLRGMRSTAAGIVETPASDHPLIWADVEAE